MILYNKNFLTKTHSMRPSRIIGFNSDYISTKNKQSLVTVEVSVSKYITAPPLQ